MVYYFITANKERPNLTDRDIATKGVHEQALLTTEQKVAQQLGVKKVKYFTSGISVVFTNIKSITRDYDADDDDGHYSTILLTDFDPLGLNKLKTTLNVGLIDIINPLELKTFPNNNPYLVYLGGVSHNLETGVASLNVSVDVGEKKDVLAYQGKGTYAELSKLGLVKKVRGSYEPLSDIVLSEYEKRPVKTKGFLGFGSKDISETVYEARKKTIEAAITNINVNANGRVSVDEKFLQNEHVQKALDAIVEGLFGLDLKPKVPVA